MAENDHRQEIQWVEQDEPSVYIILSFQGVENIRAILEWPSPKNIIELRGFIGICTYYMKFVKGFSKLTYPLTYLTKKY